MERGKRLGLRSGRHHKRQCERQRDTDCAWARFKSLLNACLVYSFHDYCPFDLNSVFHPSTEKPMI
jgi:hypothetical protein